MGILFDETIGTITMIDAVGKKVDVVVEFEFTDITSKGEVSLGVIPKTGPAAGVPIPLTGMAKMDGSMTIDLSEDFESGTASLFASLFGLVASSAALTVASPEVASDIKGLATEVKAKKRADREFRLALQEEVVATAEAKTAVRNAADNVEKLSGLLPTNQKIKVASDNLNALEKDDLAQDATLVEAMSVAQEAFLPAAELAALAGQTAAEAVVLTALLKERVTELQKVIIAKISAKAKKVDAKILADAKKAVAKKAATNLKWHAKK